MAGAPAGSASWLEHHSAVVSRSLRKEAVQDMTTPSAVEVEALEQVCLALEVLLRRLAGADGAAERDRAAAEFTTQIEALCEELARRYPLGEREAAAAIAAAIACARRLVQAAAI
jgi:hypothetical protein